MNESLYRIRRFVALVVMSLVIAGAIITSSDMWQPVTPAQPALGQASGAAIELLKTISVKGRAPKTGYARTQFGNGWMVADGCDTREIILHRDLQNPVVGDGCNVLSGTLNDPYTGKVINFKRGADTSADVQIDHVVALGDAWQTGAQLLSKDERQKLANDPLELLAVDGPANQQKSDGDAATWLPPNKSFRCQYVARQIAVKSKYHLWMTLAEYDAMNSILERCPDQSLPAA
jgi:hypothetical protein